MPGGLLNVEVDRDFALTMKGPVAEVARGSLSPSFVRGLK
jgi:diaminopimelate epimerase